MMRFILLVALFVGAFSAWIFSFPSQTLRVSFLDIGQGDSILIQGPTGVTMLVDGGPPGGGVLRELGKRMPFFDRSIDAVVETHPDADHISGLIDVLERYHVGEFIEPGIPNTTKASQNLVAEVARKHPQDILARRGMRLILGGGAYADILFPDRDLSKTETNTGSIVMHVVYGATSFYLNGDSPQMIEKYLVSLDGNALESTVLKAGHHGSKNSSAPEFVQAVAPEYGVFSRGCDNKYGHPAPVVVSLFKSLGIPTFDTCTQGTITFVSNGKTLAVSSEM